MSFDSVLHLPSIENLIENRVPSRIRAKDASLYGFDPAAQACAENFMGWATLASQPPISPACVQALADEAVSEGYTHVLLIGQGGSSQAPETMAAVAETFGDVQGLQLAVLDSVSPSYVELVLSGLDAKRTLVIASSKSGGTIEVRSNLNVVWRRFAQQLEPDELSKHFVAITDPGSDLGKRAAAEVWLATVDGEPTVGGRFSALSVFGLVPAALMGFDLGRLLECACQAEDACAADSPENPALQLACFLYDNALLGRTAFSFRVPKQWRALGVWIEQLVAESIGKNGKGIVPCVELSDMTAALDPGRQSIVSYAAAAPDGVSFGDTPELQFAIESSYDLVKHFVMWEYATAMLGWMMQVCPFDQPDVAAAKARTLEVLGGSVQGGANEKAPELSDVRAECSPALIEIVGKEPMMPSEALQSLLDAVQPEDYLCINAFLSPVGAHTDVLENIRLSLSEQLGVPVCLEYGPQYLHSTGQMHKGGPNTGLFAVLSTDEPNDKPLENLPATSLGVLKNAQATGDFSILCERNRRAIHIHAATLDALMKVLEVSPF